MTTVLRQAYEPTRGTRVSGFRGDMFVLLASWTVRHSHENSATLLNCSEESVGIFNQVPRAPMLPHIEAELSIAPDRKASELAWRALS